MLMRPQANREAISTERDVMSTPVLDVGPGIRSIYSDLVNLPNPVYLGLTVRIFNYDDVTLYMRVDGYKTGWTFTSNNLGALASGANMYRNLDNFGYRAKPAAETTETITVRLRAYTDAAYSNLKWTFERVITLVFIKSDDGSWTQDALNNFDDGTVQGWAAVHETGNGSIGSCAVATDYVLSTPYSLRVIQNKVGAGVNGARTYKSFTTTAARDTIYAIADIRLTRTAGAGNKVLRFRTDGATPAVLIQLGFAESTVTDRIPINKWMRLVVPLPKNTTLQVQLYHEYYAIDTGYDGYLWLDDFKIISK